MRKVVFMTLSLLVSGLVFSQEIAYKEPDYKGIEKIIKDETSNFFYNSLYKRYIDNDTSLNHQEYRVLYFGYLYNKNYSPYGTSDFIDSLSIFFQKDSLTNSDFLKVIHYEKLVLNDYPFNLRDLNALVYCLYNIGEADQANMYQYKIHMIVETILSTGDGRTNESGWHVISVSHEYDILNILGFKFGGQQSLSKEGCDILTLVENENGIKEFYFDVNKILEAEQELFK